MLGVYTREFAMSRASPDKNENNLHGHRHRCITHPVKRKRLANRPLFLPVILCLDKVDNQILQNFKHTVPSKVIKDVHLEGVRIAHISLDHRIDEFLLSGFHKGERVLGVLGGQFLAHAGFASIAFGIFVTMIFVFLAFDVLLALVVLFFILILIRIIVFIVFCLPINPCLAETLVGIEVASLKIRLC